MVTCAGVAGWSLGFDKHLREFRQVYENSRTWYAGLVIIAVCHRQRTCNIGNSVAISKSLFFDHVFGWFYSTGVSSTSLSG
jgi:hypothetical protein